MQEFAGRAPLAFVVDAFLVWAADDAAGHHDGQRAVSLDEFNNLQGDGLVGTHVAGLRRPIAYLIGTEPLDPHNRDDDFRRPPIVGAVEGDGRDGSTAHPLRRFLAQPLEKSILLRSTATIMEPWWARNL